MKIRQISLEKGKGYIGALNKDELIYQIALERKNDVADIALAQVISDYELNIDRILALSEGTEED